MANGFCPFVGEINFDGMCVADAVDLGAILQMPIDQQSSAKPLLIVDLEFGRIPTFGCTEARLWQ